jgi:NAD(P)H-dependent FMN reductase
MQKIIAFSASARKESFNHKLLNKAVVLARQHGEVEVIELGDFEMPLYNGDYEQSKGTPEAAKKLHEIISLSGGVMISSPEYNYSYSPLIKNTIDWLTRIKSSNTPNGIFYNKPVQLMSAAAGYTGGVRGLDHLNDVFSAIGAHVMPGLFALPACYQAFDANGDFVEEKNQLNLKNYIDRFMLFSKNLSQ